MLNGALIQMSLGSCPIQNLYHELAHAMHMMKGTWRYFKSEKQAIEEENRFRRDLARMQGRSAKLRFRKSGVMISEFEKAAGGAAVSLPVTGMDWVNPTGITKQDGLEKSPYGHYASTLVSQRLLTTHPFKGFVSRISNALREGQKKKLKVGALSQILYILIPIKALLRCW